MSLFTTILHLLPQSPQKNSEQFQYHGMIMGVRHPSGHPSSPCSGMALMTQAVKRISEMCGGPRTAATTT